jgi:hypothetical protein
LLPFSQGEIEGRRESFVDQCFGDWSGSGRSKQSAWSSLAPRIVTGGYPEAFARNTASRRAAWFGAYVTTILQRDVRDLSQVASLSELPRLLRIAATRAGGLLNYADLARDAALPRTSLQRYWALLEATFLVATLPAWTTNLGTRLVKAPKVLFNDTGLCCYLLGLDRLPERNDDAGVGALLEVFVIGELFKQTTWSGTRARLFHFRTHSQREVDLVLEDDRGRIVGVEVKKRVAVKESDFDGLKYLAQNAKKRWLRGVVLYTGEHRVAFGDKLWAVPIGSLWE